MLFCYSSCVHNLSLKRDYKLPKWTVIFISSIIIDSQQALSQYLLMVKVRASHSSCLMYMESNFQNPNKYFLSIYICLAGEETGYPPQYSCWDNPMDRGSWWVTVHEGAKSWTQLSDRQFHFHWYMRT